MDLHVEPVSIGDRVWLAARVIVMPGVRLSDDLIVGAGSVVTTSLSDSGHIYAGAPARRIRMIGEIHST
jgi:acetyltransferase-like isoleucine patch superfamily enzyme